VLRVKAAVCRAFGEPLIIEELTIEGPQAGELLVDVKACAICHSDITYMDGGWGGDLPALYGHEAAGIVRAVGAETPGIAVGDHVGGRCSSSNVGSTQNALVGSVAAIGGS
jgi:Zn-dependent alcohol dehydrogenase